MVQKFINNARTSLAQDILDQDVDIQRSIFSDDLGLNQLLIPGSNDFILLTFTDGTDYEVVQVSVNADGSYEGKRGLEGTTPREWPSNTTVENRNTAGSMDNAATPSFVSGKNYVELLLSLNQFMHDTNGSYLNDFLEFDHATVVEFFSGFESEFSFRPDGDNWWREQRFERTWTHDAGGDSITTKDDHPLLDDFIFLFDGSKTVASNTAVTYETGEWRNPALENAPTNRAVAYDPISSSVGYGTKDYGFILAYPLEDATIRVEHTSRTINPLTVTKLLNLGDAFGSSISYDDLDRLTLKQDRNITLGEIYILVDAEKDGSTVTRFYRLEDKTLELKEEFNDTSLLSDARSLFTVNNNSATLFMCIGMTDGTVFVRDGDETSGNIQSGTVLTVHPSGSSVDHIVGDISSRMFTITSNRDLVKSNILFDSDSGTHYAQNEWTVSNIHSDEITYAVYSPNLTIVTCSKDQTLKEFDLDGNLLKEITHHNAAVSHVSFISGEFVSVDTGGSVHRYTDNSAITATWQPSQGVTDDVKVAAVQSTEMEIGLHFELEFSVSSGDWIWLESRPYFDSTDIFGRWTLDVGSNAMVLAPGWNRVTIPGLEDSFAECRFRSPNPPDSLDSIVLVKTPDD